MSVQPHFPVLNMAEMRPDWSRAGGVDNPLGMEARHAADGVACDLLRIRDIGV